MSSAFEGQPQISTRWPAALRGSFCRRRRCLSLPPERPQPEQSGTCRPARPAGIDAAGGRPRVARPSLLHAVARGARLQAKRLDPNVKAAGTALLATVQHAAQPRDDDADLWLDPSVLRSTTGSLHRHAVEHLSSPFHKHAHMKSRLLGQGSVTNPRDTTGYRCGTPSEAQDKPAPGLALTRNASISFVGVFVKWSTKPVGWMGSSGRRRWAAWKHRFYATRSRICPGRGASGRQFGANCRGRRLDIPSRTAPQIYPKGVTVGCRLSNSPQFWGMGWLMGLEPTTTRITIWDSTN